MKTKQAEKQTTLRYLSQKNKPPYIILDHYMILPLDKKRREVRPGFHNCIRITRIIHYKNQKYPLMKETGKCMVNL